MCSGPPATLDYKKRSNSRLAESRRRVDGFPATAFVNWANRCSMTCSSMHIRAVSLSFEPSVLGATYHSPWHFEHKTLPWVSDTRISVLGGGRLVRSRRRGVSVVIVYCLIRCAPCTDSAATCVMRVLVALCVCAPCTDSAVTCVMRVLVALCVCAPCTDSAVT